MGARIHGGVLSGVHVLRIQGGDTQVSPGFIHGANREGGPKKLAAEYSVCVFGHSRP